MFVFVYNWYYVFVEVVDICIFGEFYFCVVNLCVKVSVDEELRYFWIVYGRSGLNWNNYISVSVFVDVGY